ncbi:MAG: hypothetical protein ACRCYU_01845 [Nocardioides sp.]
MMTGRLFLFAGFLVTLGIVLIFWPTTQQTPGSRPGGPTTPVSSASPAAPDRAGSDHRREEKQAREETAKKFIHAFTNTSLDRQDWLAGLTPYVTPDLLAGFAYTDLTRIPSGKVAGVRHLAPGDRFQIDFANGETIMCTLTDAVGVGWLVSSIEPVRALAPTGNDL